MRVLFVCEGNINRSQMAETFFRSLSPKDEVSSAGTLVPPEREGRLVSDISENAIREMRSIGFDMSSSRMHRLTPEMVEAADTIILVGPTPGGPLPDFLKTSSKLEMWGVPDPGYGQIDHASAREMIEGKVRKLVQEMVGSSDERHAHDL